MARQLKNSEVASVLTQLVAKQRGKCGVCMKLYTKRDPAVLDHDHTTGYIRGALHRSCNGVEGKVKTQAYRSHAGVAPEEYIIGLGLYLDLHSTPQYPLIHPKHMTEDAVREKRNKKAREARARKKK